MSYKFKNEAEFQKAFDPVFARVKAAEGTLRKNMDPLARTVGGYILLSHDSRPLNAVMAKLTPANRRMWALFWEAHSPFVAERDKKTKEIVRFGKVVNNNDIRDKKLALLDAWVDCSDEGDKHFYTFWQWGQDNTKTETTAKDYVAALGRDLRYALHGDKKGNGKAPIAAVIRTLIDAIEDCEELSLEKMVAFAEAKAKADAIENEALAEPKGTDKSHKTPLAGPVAA